MSCVNNNKKQSKEAIRVVVRCRPMSNKEVSQKYRNVIEFGSSKRTIRIINMDQPITRKIDFTFDDVYGPDAEQDLIFKKSVLPLVNAVMNGYNATVFAYGQTGTGKTYTMEGAGEGGASRGIIPRTFDQIFQNINLDEENIIHCSYLEIYQDKITDLLDDSKKVCQMVVDDESMFIKNLNSFECPDVETMHNFLLYGNYNRKTSSTNMNQRSSRSHAVFVINVKRTIDRKGIKQIKYGKLNMVDLAGSERQQKSKSTGLQFKEATQINLSLIALGKVMSALNLGQKHIPYRDSKLTLLLRDSLGGNAKTLMIANIGPSNFNYTESLNTLQYANRAKFIQNDPTVNEDLITDDTIPKVCSPVPRYQYEYKAPLNNHKLEQLLLNEAQKKLNRIAQYIMKLKDVLEIQPLETRFRKILSIKLQRKDLEEANVKCQTLIVLKKQNIWTEETKPGIDEQIKNNLMKRTEMIKTYNTLVRNNIAKECRDEFLFPDDTVIIENDKSVVLKNIPQKSVKPSQIRKVPHIYVPSLQGQILNKEGRLSRFRDGLVMIINKDNIREYYITDEPIPEWRSASRAYIDCLYNNGKLRKLYQEITYTDVYK